MTACPLVARVLARLASALLVALMLTSRSVAAQSATTRGSGHRHFWVTSAVLLAGALVLDERVQAVALANRTSSVDRIAGAADVLGTAGHIVPALVASYVTARSTGRRSVSDAVVRIALAYAAADAVESVLKPMVGRERPDARGRSLTFRPFTTNGSFHGFPSAHVIHIASLGTAVAEEADRAGVRYLAAGAITFVGAQRVYRNEHWASDVVGSGILGIVISRETVLWVRKREGVQ